MKKSLKMLTVAAIAGFSILPVSSAFAGYTKLGLLSCRVSAGTGLIFGSKNTIACRFQQANGQTERYTGSIGDIGIDIGKTKSARMAWVVFQVKDKQLRHYPLAGSYYGVSAGASLVRGLGANALVGGNSQAIGLQPLSVESRKGVNINLGLAGMRLRPSR